MLGRLTLRERVAVLMLAALAPVIVLSLWVAARETSASIALAQSQLRFAASLLATNQDRTVDAAEQMLTAIAGVDELRTLPHARCQAYFERLVARYPMYSNIGLVAPDGAPICHANGAQGDASVADRGYFQDALAQKRFVVGAPIVGRLSGKRSLPVALPVVEGGAIKAVAFAALDLGYATAALAGVDLPEGARVLVAERNGQLLMESPARADLPLPRRIVQPQLLEAARNLSSTVGEITNVEGQERVFAVAPSRRTGSGAFVVGVSMARSTVLAGTTTHWRDALLVLLLGTLAAMAATWWIGGWIIIAPAREILRAVRRLEKADLDARIPMKGMAHRGEYARIGAAFNLMADSLQVRQRHLENELSRSRGAYEVLDLVLNSMQDGLIALTTNGQYLMYNEAAARLFPLDGPPAVPREWPIAWGLYHPDGQTLYRADDVPQARAVRGESGRQQPVFVRNAQVPEGRMLHCSYQPVRSDAGVSGGLVVFTDVTELHRLQAGQAAQLEQLGTTQRKLAEAQRAGRIGNWELDLTSGRSWWSDQVFEMLGLDPQAYAASQENYEQLIHPDDRERHAAAVARAIKEAGPMDVEYRVVKPGGEVAWMHDIAAARAGDDGRTTWIGGVVQDITQRKRAEADLVLLRNAVARLNDIVVISEYQPSAILDPHIVFANEAFERLLGYTVQEAIGLSPSLLNLYGPNTDAFMLEQMRDALSRGQPSRGELVHYTRDGRELWLEVDVVPMIMGTADTAYLIAVMRDSSARRLAELENARLFAEISELNASLEARIAERTAELARQELVYRTLAEQAPEVIWNTDAEGRTTFLNQAWYDLVGGEPGEWLGYRWLKRVHPDDLPLVQRNWENSRDTLQPYSGVRRVLARDDTYHTMSYKAAPVLGDDGKVAFWVGIDTDITGLKAIEQALRGSNQELEAFSYSVSHDLRAPLGAISGFSKALAGKLEGHPDDRVRHYLARIQAGVDKMEELIDALLSLAKVARAQLDWASVDLTALARDVADELQSHEPDRQVAFTVQEGLVVHGDARMLRAALQNLLGNAWKFTAQRKDAAIEVGRRAADGVFYVRDNGVGFDMNYAGKLFVAFQRLHTEAEFPGTGIGLATVRRIIARHQGRVWAESTLGEGTTFFFTLSDAAPPAWLADADSP